MPTSPTSRQEPTILLSITPKVLASRPSMPLPEQLPLVRLDPDPEPEPDPVVKQPELYAVQRITEYVKKGQNTKIVSTLANEGNTDYNGSLKLYALPAESKMLRQPPSSLKATQR